MRRWWMQSTQIPKHPGYAEKEKKSEIFNSIFEKENKKPSEDTVQTWAFFFIKIKS